MAFSVYHDANGSRAHYDWLSVSRQRNALFVRICRHALGYPCLPESAIRRGCGIWNFIVHESLIRRLISIILRHKDINMQMMRYTVLSRYETNHNISKDNDAPCCEHAIYSRVNILVDAQISSPIGVPAPRPADSSSPPTEAFHCPERYQ